MIAAPGATLEASVGYATGVLGILRVRIVNTPAGATFLAATTTGVTEAPAGGGIYFWTGPGPTTAGTYTIYWDLGSDATIIATEDLLVTSTASTPAVGSDLCSLADVKAYLQKDGSVTGVLFDSTLSTLITRASAVIENYASREFSDKGTLTRTFAQDSYLVDLLPYDLRTPTVVTIDPSGAATVITTDEYALRPLNRTTLGTYVQLHTGYYTSLYSERRSAFGASELSITGSWGAATTPLPVVQACVVTVGLWFRREIAARGVGSSDYDLDGADLRPLSMPGAAQRLVDPYRRTVLA